jgi:tagatose-1,6-bisphosphate aldolase non-catalytic subunit AgaZ/GatZ
VKGLHRTQLLVALFANKGYIFSHNYGVKNRDTQEIEASTPAQAIELLNKLYKADFTPEILENYFSVMDSLKNNLSEQDLNRVYDIYLKILDSTRADIPEDLQDYWIKNQERLQLKGKFLPDDSNLVKYKVQ